MGSSWLFIFGFALSSMTYEFLEWVTCHCAARPKIACLEFGTSQLQRVYAEAAFREAIISPKCAIA